jgi:hypothetical protein
MCCCSGNGYAILASSGKPLIPTSSLLTGCTDETVVNGAQIFYGKEFGIDGKDERSTWLLGLTNSAPYLCCALIGPLTFLEPLLTMADDPYRMLDDYSLQQLVWTSRNHLLDLHNFCRRLHLARLRKLVVAHVYRSVRLRDWDRSEICYCTNGKQFLLTDNFMALEEPEP